MVWCPIHYIYLHGRQAKSNHAQEGCSFIEGYKRPKKEEGKYNDRKNGQDNADHKTPYFWKEKEGNGVITEQELKRKVDRYVSSKYTF